MLSQITLQQSAESPSGETFEVVAYQPHWIHDGKKGWEDITRLDQRRSYSLALCIEINWEDEQTGWTSGTGWGMGGGWLDEEVNNGNVDRNDE